MDTLAGAMIGSYRLTRHLGSGYSEAFLAQRPESTGSHAFMVVKATQADRGDGLARELLATAERVAQLCHPNIVSIVEAGVDGRAAFLAMPYLPMGPIAALVHAQGVAPALVAPIIVQASHGLRAAHTIGVAHGDLKPNNLFLHTEGGRPPLALVSDFGQAALVSAALQGATPLSPDARCLIAPEQYTGPAIPASDQYALAVIACLLLTGRYPHDAGDDPRQPLSAACVARLPAEVAPALRRALAYDPAARYDDISAFAAAFDAGLANAKGVMLAAPRARKAAAPAVDGPIASPTTSGIATAAPDAKGHATTPPAGATYAPTGVALVDGLLQRVDERTHGKAGVLQRAVAYIIIGGIAAVINLAALYVFYNAMTMPFSSNLHWLIAFVVAAVISTMASFVLNDWITFSRLPGHARSWVMRCLRFFSTSLLGTIVTLIVSFACKTWLGMSALIAEAVAIIIALFFNFTMHHVWTYRHVKQSHSAPPDGQPASQPQEALATPKAR